MCVWKRSAYSERVKDKVGRIRKACLMRGIDALVSKKEAYVSYRELRSSKSLEYKGWSTHTLKREIDRVKRGRDSFDK